MFPSFSRALPFRACFNAVFNLVHYPRLEMRNDTVKRRSISLFGDNAPASSAQRFTIRARHMYTWPKVKCLHSSFLAFGLISECTSKARCNFLFFFVPWQFLCFFCCCCFLVSLFVCFLYFLEKRLTSSLGHFNRNRATFVIQPLSWILRLH